MIRTYEELTDEEQSRLAKAWEKVAEGLRVYEEITGADLLDVTGDELWENVVAQKNDEEEE